MDVVSHIAFGRALAALFHRDDLSIDTLPRRRALTAAIVMGAIAPDVDAVLMPFGWDRYLIWHERGTHALLGILILAILLASVIRLIQMLLNRTPTAWPRLWLAALAGCGSHLLLDAVCGGSLHLLWPLSDEQFSRALVGMADPLLLVPLVLFLILAAIWRRRATALATALVAVMIVVLSVKNVSRTVAVRAYEHSLSAHAGEPVRQPPAPAIEARWGSRTDWFVYDRTATHVRVWQVVGGADEDRVELYLQRPLAVQPNDAALVEASRQLDTVTHALSLFDFAFPEVIDRGDGTTEVLWSDIRFCRPAMCDLRFGGRFDRNGEALEQVVYIGTIRQSRSLPSHH